MSKLFRSKMFIGVLCIVLAAVVAFLFLPRFYSSQAATESVIRVVQDVSAGSVITGSMVTTSEVGAYGLPSDVIRGGTEVVGMVAGENLYAGEYLLDKRLMTEEAYKETLTQSNKGLVSGMSLLTIEFPSFSAGIAGVLRGGDTVDVYQYTTEKDESGEEVSQTTLAIRGLYVCDVLNRNMQSLNELDEMKETLPEGDTTSFDFAPAYVVFRCTRADIRTLIQLERAESLHLALTKAVG